MSSGSLVNQSSTRCSMHPPGGDLICQADECWGGDAVSMKQHPSATDAYSMSPLFLLRQYRPISLSTCQRRSDASQGRGYSNHSRATLCHTPYSSADASAIRVSSVRRQISAAINRLRRGSTLMPRKWGQIFPKQRAIGQRRVAIRLPSTPSRERSLLGVFDSGSG